MATQQGFSSTDLKTHRKNLPSLLAVAQPFLRGELEKIDPEIPSFLSILRSAGAGERHHKNGAFLAHLLNFHRIVRLWGAPSDIARCGLFHSSYANSYVNVSIFESSTTREDVQRLIGAPVERLAFLFCAVPRHKLIHEELHFQYTDTELRDHLAASDLSIKAARETGTFDASEAWREKICKLLPPKGMEARHFKTGEPISLSRRIIALFVLMTIADICDQYIDYQDKLYDNENGRLEFRGDNWGALWPGTCKPGLWMNAASRLGVLYNLIIREEELYTQERNKMGETIRLDRDEEIMLVIPPVFNYCTKVLDPKEQIAARDLYWEAICSDDRKERDWEKVEKVLLESIQKNPFVGEPRLVAAQVYLNMERYAEAKEEAEEGLKLLLEWGISWDKRMTWESWVSWGRVMLDKAKENEWPHTAAGIINLGLVK
ncbi:hypothetical protein SORBI_3004G354500 [Sorghum bicolor]|uniref:DUF6817 domain-containing protein n=2 Tax=Sorghum bicolor TaxID=4558 RepID=A0A1Z5RRE7_SORBI|nr:hypothetical protein SORBI_3004G354500 [Sorghum bicolor]